MMISPMASLDIRGSYGHSEPHRRSNSRIMEKSAKKDTDDEVSSREESEWEEQRPRKFPVKDERDVVLRKVRSVLNKISSVNFIKLRKRWLTLIPNDEVQVMEIIRLVVKKAMDEPMYMQIYARLFGYAFSQQPVDIEFKLRNSLIVHIHNCLQRLATDLEIAKFDRSVERETFARQKKVHLHRFIAELFLENVCNPKFVAERVTDLVGQGKRSAEDADEPLESLCVLLTFAGAKLEETKGMWLNDILLKLNLREAACSPNISKRIQFMVLDLLEMRSKGWVPHNKWWTPSVPLRTESRERYHSSP